MTHPIAWGGTRPTVIAHRGASSEAPENTLAAFDAAVEAAEDAAETQDPRRPVWIELDLQPTADGEVVVIHDDRLDRTTDGHGLVRAHTLAELQRLDAGGWFDGRRAVGAARAYAGERIPSLDDLIDWIVAHPVVRVLVEYKGEWAPADITRTVAAFEAAGVLDRLVLQSFQPGTVDALRLRAGDRPRGLLIDMTRRYPEVELARLLDVSAVNPGWRRVVGETADAGLVPAVHDRLGARVAVWTPDEPALWDALVAVGVDAIITNRPRELRSHLG